MKFTVLASGSKGNATYLEIGSKNVLIDAGISLRQIQSRMEAASKRIDHLDAVFITHEHIDHVIGLAAIANKFKMPVYMTQGSYHNLNRKIKESLGPDGVKIIDYSDVLLMDGFVVKPLVTYHDALEPCGYKFTEAGKSLVYITDTGYYPQGAFDMIRNAECYIIESNHDPEMLLDSDRPWQLKRRILDDEGHLSNEDSAFLLANVLGEKTKKIILAHLSQECNTKVKALEKYSEVFTNQGLVYQDYQIECADQDTSLAEVQL